MKIGDKLTIGFVSISLLIGAVGVISLRIGQRMLQKSIGENSAVFAAQLLDKIDRNIYYKIEEFQAYANGTLLEKTLIASNTEFDNIPDPNTHITNIENNWTTPSGQPGPVMTDLMSNALAGELKTIAQFFADKYGYAVVGEIFVANRYGANVAQTGPTTDYYQADEFWWQNAKDNGLSIEDVNFDDSSKVYSTVIAVRITSGGNFAGVLKAVLNIQGVIDGIEEAKKAAGQSSMHLTLLNKDGKIIYSTRPFFRYLEDASILLGPGSALPHDAQHTCYFIGSNGSNKKALFAHANSKGRKDYKGLGWRLVVEHDYAEILAPIIQLRDNVLIISLSIMAFAAATGILTSRTISRPIAALKDATVEISKGNLDAAVAVHSSDEIGQLAASFEKMASDLKNTVDTLNSEIAERKKTQKSLEKSEERFRQIVENAKEWIWEVNTEGLYTYSNSIVENILGYRTEEVVGKIHFYDLFHPDDREELKNIAFETFSKKQPFYKLLNRNIHKDGTIVWLLTSGVPILDENGNVLGYRGTDMDITEQKLAVKNLEESKNWLRAILDNVQTAFFIIDPQTHLIVDANPLAVKLIGASREQLIGSLCHKFICPAEIGRCPITDLGQNVDNSERILLTAKGEQRPIIKTVATVMLGGREHLLESFIDITERRQTEQAMEKLNKDLEATVGELIRSNLQLQEFVHIAAHDLKTPLRGIGTLADWLATDYTDKFDRQGQDQLNLLVTRVKRIDKLIDGMLRYSRIKRDRKNEQNINLASLLAEIVSEIEPPQNIKIDIQDHLPEVVCEKTHIKQVFQNLLTNAVTYMDKPQGLITVACKDEGEFWRFAVTDNGCGIEQKYFDRIFRIFQTLAPRDDLESAGIGLTAARKIVELYIGRIWVESTLGQGSSFFFTWPKQRKDVQYAELTAYTAC